MPTRRLNPLCDRIGRENVERVIAEFYLLLRSDDLLSPFFVDLKNPAEHERRIVEYWWIAMGGKPLGAPVETGMVSVHAGLGLTAAHFERWLELFRKTLDSSLDPPLAKAWMIMAGGVAARLRSALAIV
ncbi:hypothetical protein BJI67_15490 [Acidihalobacter aeolianus]|uniref:Globin n=1 Tax=Acidihalobacter aeolianus TaxID=2792603 RepID=A0A1D8KBD5_9GAMM|nr:group III truncated hemoglobin [Acidihalobacter aeolianus]AOV18278.1 hypothetical protein BJI67_15490 [Acidihalobacter aeolianus]